MQDNEEQRHKIDILKENLHLSEQLKEQVAEQCKKIDKLQNIIDYETIGLSFLNHFLKFPTFYFTIR